MKFKKYITKNKETLLYTGTPNIKLLDQLAEEEGDLWHSSLNQGYKNCFQDLIYQTAVFWWFNNDLENLDKCVSWRINPNQFVIREKVWNQLKGFDMEYQSLIMSGLDFGFNFLKNNNGIPLYIKGLFPNENNVIKIARDDRYLFFFKNFKPHHALYMLLKKGIFLFPIEIISYVKAKKNKQREKTYFVKPRKLNDSIIGEPSVSLIIPTMKRQEFTQLLLEDHKKQTYLIKEAIIVDGTPINERDEKFYKNEEFPFEVIVKWQKTKGSCRARNEAIELASGDYIIFADDDIRIQQNFVENHIKLLQTYNVKACNGLDIQAYSLNDDLNDLEKRLDDLGENRYRVGISSMFSNANSCIHSSILEKVKGNDVNFDGGYGEDGDFGFRILKQGNTLLHNPYSANLHLKPPKGGYRWWGSQANIFGEKRKKQPWELDKPVKYIKPVPSPTITYGVLKHFTKTQVIEWRSKYMFIYLFKNELKTLPLRIFRLPYKYLQFSKSLQYAKALLNLGERFK